MTVTILPGLPGFTLIWWVVTRFYWFWWKHWISKWIKCHWNCLIRLSTFLSSFAELCPRWTYFYAKWFVFNRILPDFIGFYRVLPGFTGFYRVFTGFLPSFTECEEREPFVWVFPDWNPGLEWLESPASQLDEHDTITCHWKTNSTELMTSSVHLR